MSSTPNREHHDQAAQQRWRRVESLFHETMERPEPERQDFLERHCAEDRAIIDEVLELLRSCEASTEFLEGAGPNDPTLLTELWQELASAQGISDGGRTDLKPGASNIGEGAAADVESTDDPLSAARSSGFDLEEFQRKLREVRPELEVLERIGKGGAGLVFKVRDHRLDRDLALKVLYRESKPGASAEWRQIATALEREGRACAALASDYIVRIYDIGAVDERQTFLLLEWICGPSLQAVLQTHEFLQAEEAALIARHVALGLGVAHRHGLIHGDVKPANILLEPLEESPRTSASNARTAVDLEGLKPFRAKVTDFGLARAVQPIQPYATRSSGFTGTPAYASPELLIDRQGGDARSDVWSLGVTLYRMLTGVAPFRGAPHAIVQQMRGANLTPPRRLEPQIPRDLESICLKALANDPNRRYADGNEFAADLQRFLQGEPTLARPLSVWHQVGRWVARNPRQALAAASLALALLTLFVGALVSSAVFARQRQQVIDSKRAADFARLQRILEASPALLPALLDFEDIDRQRALPLLRKWVSDPQRDDQSRLNAAVALAELGEPQTDVLIQGVLHASLQPEQCQNLIRGLRHDAIIARERLRELFEQVQEPQRRARLAIVVAHLGEFEPFEMISAQDLRPDLRTTLIHLWPAFHGQLDETLAMLDGDISENMRYTLGMALNLVDREPWSLQDRQRVGISLQRQLDRTRDAGVRGAAALALVHWRGEGSQQAKPATDRPWREFSPDLRLVRIPAADNILGRTNPSTLHQEHQPHHVTLTQPYWIADREVSVGQYQMFLDDTAYPEEFKPLVKGRQRPDGATSPTSSHPVQRISWNDAALFCNWLSWRHGKRPRYQMRPVTEPAAEESAGNNRSLQYSDEWWVVIDREADGFRLPTEAQWEMACRAGSQTNFFFGDDFDLFRHYGVFSSARVLATARCGTLLPNRWGLHDMHGNVWEWSETWYEPLGREPLVDPEGPLEPNPKYPGRSFLGGGVQTLSGEPISGARGWASPDNRFGNVGFRVSLPD